MIPHWLSTLAHTLFALCAVLAALLPVLTVLVLVVDYFVARHRGLAKRTSARWAVSIEGDDLHVERDGVRRRLPLRSVVRARFARNENWTESKLLEDALGLFTASGREVARLPESAQGLDALVTELARRGVAIEPVYVGAPAYLD